VQLLFEWGMPAMDDLAEDAKECLEMEIKFDENAGISTG